MIPRFKQSSSHSKRAVPPCMNSQSCSRSTFVSELLPEDVPMDRLLTGLEDNRLEGIVVKRKDSRYLEARNRVRGSNIACTQLASS